MLSQQLPHNVVDCVLHFQHQIVRTGDKTHDGSRGTHSSGERLRDVNRSICRCRRCQKSCGFHNKLVDLVRRPFVASSLFFHLSLSLPSVFERGLSAQSQLDSVHRRRVFHPPSAAWPLLALGVGRFNRYKLSAKQGLNWRFLRDTGKSWDCQP